MFMGRIYLISEGQYKKYKKVVFKYLNDIGWREKKAYLYNETYLYSEYQGNDFTFMAFNDYLDDDTPYRILDVDLNFYNQLKGLFKLREDHLDDILIEWYYFKTREKVEEVTTFNSKP